MKLLIKPLKRIALVNKYSGGKAYYIVNGLDVGFLFEKKDVNRMINKTCFKIFEQRLIPEFGQLRTIRETGGGIVLHTLNEGFYEIDWEGYYLTLTNDTLKTLKPGKAELRLGNFLLKFYNRLSFYLKKEAPKGPGVLCVDGYCGNNYNLQKIFPDNCKEVEIEI
jgi:hypothetical protein